MKMIERPAPAGPGALDRVSLSSALSGEREQNPLKGKEISSRVHEQNPIVRFSVAAM
jgi:hypothetical protein